MQLQILKQQPFHYKQQIKDQEVFAFCVGASL